jgi:hypothetical protein
VRCGKIVQIKGNVIVKTRDVRFPMTALWDGLACEILRGEMMTLTPNEAAKKIVAELLSDLPTERQESVMNAIKVRMSDWGDLTSSVASESMDR